MNTRAWTGCDDPLNFTDSLLNIFVSWNVQRPKWFDQSDLENKRIGHYYINLDETNDGVKITSRYLFVWVSVPIGRRYNSTFKNKISTKWLLKN